MRIIATISLPVVYIALLDTRLITVQRFTRDCPRPHGDPVKSNFAAGDGYPAR